MKNRATEGQVRKQMTSQLDCVHFDEVYPYPYGPSYFSLTQLLFEKASGLPLWTLLLELLGLADMNAPCVPPFCTFKCFEFERFHKLNSTLSPNLFTELVYL